MKNEKKHLYEISLKEAVGADIGNIVSRNSVLSDPAPSPFVPIAPLVAGAKVVHGAKKTIAAIGQRLLGK